MKRNNYTIDEIIERMVTAIYSVQGEDVARIANHEFGMNIEYIGGDMFQEVVILDFNKDKDNNSQD